MSKLVSSAEPDPPDWRDALGSLGAELAHLDPPIVGVEFSVSEFVAYRGYKSWTHAKHQLDAAVAEGKMTCRQAILPTGKRGTVYRVVQNPPKV